MSIYRVILSILILITAGLLGGWLIKKLKLPMVLGFILAGMLIGPYGFNIVDPVSLNESDMFKTFQVLVIGYLGYYIGTEIVFSEIKKYGKSVLIIGLFEAYIPFLIMLFIAHYVFKVDWIVSAIFGAIALSTAPGPVLSIIKEYKANGPISKLLMPLAAIDSVIAVITFGFVLSIADSFYLGKDISIIEPILTIGLSLILGLLSGFITKVIFSHIKNKLLIFITFLVIIFTTMLIAIRINADLILTGILVGVIVRNYLPSENRKIVLATLSPPANLAIIMFLVLLGTDLDYTMLFNLKVVMYACVYIIARAIGKYIGIYLGSSITDVSEKIKKYMGITLLPHAGVSLTFSIIAYEVISPTAVGLNGYPSREILLVIIATAATINELIAVLAVKWGLKKAGEF